MLHAYLAFLVAASVLVAAGCGGSSKTTTTSTSTTSASTADTTTTTGTTVAGTTITSIPPAPIVSVKVASGKPLTRSQWIAKGNEVCGRLKAELEAIKVKATGELPRVLPQVAATERAEIAQLATLVPPSSKRSDWQQFLNISLQRAEDTARTVALARLGDAISQAPIFATVRGLQRELAAIAKRDGLRECAPA